jgi:hypothetical protein
VPASERRSSDIHGGGGEDRIGYGRLGGHTLAVSLDGVRNDGRGCPGACVPDNVYPTIEDITASNDGRNTLVGSARANLIRISTGTRRALDSTCTAGAATTN